MFFVMQIAFWNILNLMLDLEQGLFLWNINWLLTQWRSEVEINKKIGNRKIGGATIRESQKVAPSSSELFDQHF